MPASEYGDWFGLWACLVVAGGFSFVFCRLGAVFANYCLGPKAAVASVWLSALTFSPPAGYIWAQGGFMGEKAHVFAVALFFYFVSSLAGSLLAGRPYMARKDMVTLALLSPLPGLIVAAVLAHA